MPIEAGFVDESENSFLKKFGTVDGLLSSVEAEIRDNPSPKTLLRFFCLIAQVKVCGIRDAEGEFVPGFYKNFFERLQRAEERLKEKLGEEIVTNMRKKLRTTFVEKKGDRLTKETGLSASVKPRTAAEKNRRRGGNRVGLTPAERKLKRAIKKTK